jgi:hypothetical protein
MAMTKSDIIAITKGLAGPVKELVARSIEPLEARLAELEAGGIRYAGTWQRALAYKRGSCVTHDGSMFVALRDTPEGEKPGASDYWQLAVKGTR